MLATASLTSYAFYLPLSIMITPMLLESPTGETNNGNVTYLKLYLMSINVIKSLMLLVAIMGPEGVATAVISSMIASFLLGTLTFTWFQSQSLLSSHYYTVLHPCNIAFINFWKAASYMAAIASAVIMVIAHAFQESIISNYGNGPTCNNMELDHYCIFGILLPLQQIYLTKAICD